jgi:hypothetical protein
MWDFLLDGYNNQMNTNHKNTREMLIELYNAMGSSVACADFLGIAQSTVYNRLIKDHVPRLTTKGYGLQGYRTLKQKLEWIPDAKLKTMTAKEIANATGKEINYVRKFLRLNNIEYKRIYKKGE